MIIELPDNCSWDEWYLGLAKYLASRSKDPSTQVGAVIVRPDKSVCSTGYNGFPQKMPDDPLLYLNREEKYSRIVHAEVNAVLFAREPLNGYTLYTYPFMPCDRCFTMMVQKGLARFVAPVPTKDQEERWGVAFERVKKYALEMNVELVVINFQ